MFTHKQVWNAIDVIAERYGFSASGLAKKAGLDPTSFNPSKRNGPDGRPRWPTMESIARVLNASGAPVDEYMELLSGKKGRTSQNARHSRCWALPRRARAASSMIPVFPRVLAGTKIEAPGVTDTSAYALEITGDSMAPVYREGDTIIVSPGATIRKGDRVVVRTSDGQVMAKIMQKQSARSIELASFNPDHPLKTLEAKNVDWMARIIWASQ